MEFYVTLCLGRGDGGDVSVYVDVSDEERELLKQCYRDDKDINGYKGLEDLYERIREAAIEENESCMEYDWVDDDEDEDEDDDEDSESGDEDDEERIDYDSVGFMISMPEEITEEVDSEEEEDEEK